MPNLLVVLQTHSLGDSQHYLKLHDLKRFCGADKPEIMRRCTLSLVESLNYAVELIPDLEVNLQVFDDHSDERSLSYLRANIDKARFLVTLEHLETKGIMPSILKCYEYGRDNTKEWVYFAQDDYLHDRSAIYDMIHAAHEFSRNLNAPVSIYPFNDPFKYAPINTTILSHIVRSQGRHWRTQVMTASCFMTHKLVLDANWDMFEKMGKSQISPVMEDESINQIFRTRGYHLFVPIPSLALHMQYCTEEDPLMNWREWWDRYPLSDSIDINPKGKSILNVGSGKSTMDDAIFVEDLVGCIEYRLDIDNDNNPDICLDATNLSGLSDNQFDVVYTSHMMEHLDYFQVIPTIKDFLRITKSNGEVRIIVPNLKAIASEIANGNLLGTLYNSPGGPISALDMLYGHRASILYGTEFMRHKTGFTKESFEFMLKEANIDNFIIEEKDFDLLIKIYKNTAGELKKAA